MEEKEKQISLEAYLRGLVKEEMQEGLDVSVLTDSEKMEKQRRMLLQKYGVIPPQPISKRQMRSMARRWKEKHDV